MSIELRDFGVSIESVAHDISTWVWKKATWSPADGIVVGLSGGLDSAVTAALCVKAVGENNVRGVLMPSDVTPDEDMRDARDLADQLGISPTTHPVQGAVDAINASGTVPPEDKVTLGNIAARARMTILYMYANMDNYLVAGTGNKSELAIGYFTKYGDGACDILPIADLYKTEVRRLAEFLDIPDAIIDKEPSAGLWEGQTDEDEIGVPYETLDKILRGIELKYPTDKIADEVDARLSFITGNVMAKMYMSEHKRKMPPFPQIHEENHSDE